LSCVDLSGNPGTLLKIDPPKVATCCHSIAASAGHDGKSGNKEATNWQHVASFVATSRCLEEFLRGISSRFGRPAVDRTENFHHAPRGCTDQSLIWRDHAGFAQRIEMHVTGGQVPGLGKAGRQVLRPQTSITYPRRLSTLVSNLLIGTALCVTFIRSTFKLPRQILRYLRCCQFPVLS